MVEHFKRCKFLLNVATPMDYDEGIVFTENNITTYLAELEEYISALVTVTAYKREDHNAATSAIPLSQLDPKDFGKKDIEVSEPILNLCLHLFIDQPTTTNELHGCTDRASSHRWTLTW